MSRVLVKTTPQSACWCVVCARVCKRWCQNGGNPMVAQVKQASYSMNGLDFGGIIAPRQGIRIMVPYNAERQAVRIARTSGSAFDVGGTFKLTFGGRDTAPIRFNASAAEVRQALVDTMHTRCDYPNDDSPSQRMYVGRV